MNAVRLSLALVLAAAGGDASAAARTDRGLKARASALFSAPKRLLQRKRTARLEMAPDAPIPTKARSIRPIEVATVAAQGLTLLPTMFHIAHQVDSPEKAAGVVLGALGGWAAADLVSGLAHHAFDNYGTPETPLIGQQVNSFRRHHRFPRELLNWNFWGTTFSTARVTLLPSVLLAMHTPHAWKAAGLATLLSGLPLTPWVHRWAHMPAEQRPGIVKLGQRLKLLLPSDHHDEHHKNPRDVKYAVLSGWWNPILDNGALATWERTWYRARGAIPEAWRNHPEIAVPELREQLAADKVKSEREASSARNDRAAALRAERGLPAREPTTSP